MIHWRWPSENPRSACADGQRDVHDGGVEHDHELGEADHDERHPAPRFVGVGGARVEDMGMTIYGTIEFRILVGTGINLSVICDQRRKEATAMTQLDLDEPKPRLGRKRDHTRDPEILDAALDVLAETGYDGMTIDMVAARAKAGKATLYRRWASKSELVLDAVACMKSTDVDLASPPDTGTLRGDLVAMVKTPTIRESERKLKVMAGIVSMIARDPELAAAAQRGARRAARGGEPHHLPARDRSRRDRRRRRYREALPDRPGDGRVSHAHDAQAGGPRVHDRQHRPDHPARRGSPRLNCRRLARRPRSS